MLAACLIVAASPAMRPAGPPLVIPHPKETDWAPASVSIDARTIISTGKSEMDMRAAEAIVREIVKNGGPKLAITHERLIGRDVIWLGEPGRMQWLPTAEAHEIPANPQGYWLSVNGGLRDRPRIVVAGRTPQATFYGAQTLCQIIRAGGEVTGGKVRDWPSLGWRGVHLFLGNQALPFHERLITNVLSRFKFNAILLQCEQAKWKTLGKIAPDWAMPIPELRQELRFARSYGFHVEPLVNSVGHMQWLMKGTTYSDLSEDLKVPYNICPTDPRTYPLLTQLYKEVLRTFHSRVMHVGGDEVVYGGKYPCRSARKYPRLCDLYAAHIRRLHDILKRMGVRTQIWADMLLPHKTFPDCANAPDDVQAKYVRDHLPKDIELIDWHYGDKEGDARLDAFESSGFHGIVGAGYQWPFSTWRYCGELAARHQRGYLQTTWVGYNSQEKNLRSYPQNFAAFIVSADEAWNGGTVRPDKLGYDPAEVFQAAYGPAARPAHQQRRAG